MAKAHPAWPGVPNPRRDAPVYPGDHRGPIHFEYAPNLDGDADPGEVVWSWVPFEDDPTVGKDRPVLVIARDHPWVLVLQLTTVDHDRDKTQEENEGRFWFEIGSGPWDKTGRPNEARLNRIIRLDPLALRREGAVLDRLRFEQVVQAMGKVPAEHNPLMLIHADGD